MAVQFLAAIPLATKVVVGVSAVVGLIGVFGYKKYAKHNAPIYFLKGEPEAGKDTILHILMEAKFVSNETTPKLEKLDGEPLNTPKGYIRFFNTSGSLNESNAKGGTIEAIETMNELMDKRKVQGFFLYVFDANVYFNNEKIKKIIELEINMLKEYKEKYTLKFIGTHKDECSVDDSQIQNLEAKFGGADKCKIWNLKEAETNGKKIQKELFEFIES